MMKQAANLSEIQQSFAPRPLRREELEEFFVLTDDARDPVVSRRDLLRKALKRNPGGNQKMLLAGHRGCGKSSELVKLADELSPTFVTASFSVEDECNLAHVPIEDVLVVMMERLAAVAEEAELSDKLAQSQALDWEEVGLGELPEPAEDAGE